MHQISALKALAARVEGDHDIGKIVRRQIEDLTAEVEALLKANAEPDPMASETAQRMRMDAAKERLRRSLSASRSHVAPLIEKMRTEEQSQRLAKARFVQNEFAAETRTVFPSLSSEERHRFLGDAIATQDGPTVAAIVEVPHLLTGLTPQQQAHYKASFLDTAAPAEKSAAELLRETYGTAVEVASALAT